MASRKRKGVGQALPGKRARLDDEDRFQAWINSYPKVSKWLAQYDLEALLDAGGGLVRIDNFLPPFVAQGALQLLESIPPAAWNNTSAEHDYKANNIAHSFLSTKHAPGGLDALLRVFSLLQPGELHSFSAAQYTASDHIAPHDDRAYTDVLLEDGSVVVCSRTLAAIYYLTQDWTLEYGGALVDVEGGATLVPRFNSLVAFRVPRFHEVTPLTGLAGRPRYSLYDLFGGDAAAAAAAAEDGEEKGGDNAGGDDSGGERPAGSEENTGSAEKTVRRKKARKHRKHKKSGSLRPITRT